MTSSVHISGTPTKRGGRITGYSKHATIDHCVANSDGVQDVQFFDKYLQPLDNDTIPIRWGWKAFKGRIQKKFKESSEKAIYDPVASLLNKISCIVYQDMYPTSTGKDGKANCIFFRDTSNIPPQGIDKLSIRPDLTATRMQYHFVNKHIETPPDSKILNLFWHLLDSFAEGKDQYLKEGDIIQSRGYASRMPESRPDLAGVLYIVTCKKEVKICWSDASRAVQSPSLRWFAEGKDEFDDNTLKYLFRFVKTLYTPLPDFTQIDPTVRLVSGDDEKIAKWAVKIKGTNETFIGTRLCSSPAYGRQTYVMNAHKYEDESSSDSGSETGSDTGTETPVESETDTASNTSTTVTSPADSESESDDKPKIKSESEYVIKDYWRDGSRRFREADLYAKANGVRGMAQMYHGERVTDENGEQLKTSDYHSGKDSVLGGKAKQRFKERIVLNSTGEPLETRKTLLEFLEAMYDVVQTHQTLVNKKGIVHRDLSPNNILLNMRHNEDCEFDDYPDEKYIHEVLNGPPKEGEEKVIKGGTIDFDNGANMKDDNDCNGTERTGTRKYIAVRVATGRSDFGSYRIEDEPFLDLSGDALNLYIKAYGEESYQSYITKLNESRVTQNNRGVVFKQLPIHDAESIIWIIVDHLLRAIPVNGKPQVNDFAIGALKAFLVHSIENCGDTRSSFSNFSLEEWIKCLHPGLSHTAPFLHKLCRLLCVDWSLWCLKGELPDDFLHEAVKRILLEEIVRIRAENQDVRLGPKDREPVITTTIGADAGMGESKTKRKSTTILASSSKRSRIITELD